MKIVKLVLFNLIAFTLSACQSEAETKFIEQCLSGPFEITEAKCKCHYNALKELVGKEKMEDQILNNRPALPREYHIQSAQMCLKVK